MLNHNSSQYIGDNGNAGNINVAALCNSTKALGPGIRSVVWVQGCPFHCRGCIAPDWIPFQVHNVISPIDLAKELLRDPEVTGLTISGGEPMHQSSSLVEVVNIVKTIRDLDVICYTGYMYEQLKRFPEESGVANFLKVIDVLIDGPYVQSKNNGIGLRGSYNQNIIHLTDRLKSFDFEMVHRRLEINIADQEILMVGIPPNQINTDILFAYPESIL